MHTTANSFLILLLPLSLSTLSISLANASSLTSRKNNAIYQKIVNSGTSKDPLDSLTVDERRFFEDFTAVASENSSSFIAAPSLIRATPISGCWNASIQTYQNNVFGNLLFTTTVEGKWCYASGRITSSTETNHWGQTHMPEWFLTSSKPSSGIYGTVSARMVANNYFSFRPLGYELRGHTQCARLIGYNKGVSVSDNSCSVQF